MISTINKKSKWSILKTPKGSRHSIIVIQRLLGVVVKKKVTWGYSKVAKFSLVGIIFFSEAWKIIKTNSVQSFDIF